MRTNYRALLRRSGDGGPEHGRLWNGTGAGGKSRTCGRKALVRPLHVADARDGRIMLN